MCLISGVYRKKKCAALNEHIAMKKHNICEIGCDRIVSGAYDCSAPNKVNISKLEKEVVL